MDILEGDSDDDVEPQPAPAPVAIGWRNALQRPVAIFMMLSLASLAASEECAAQSPVVVIPASDAANSTRHFASVPCETAAASVLARIPENMISTNAAPGEGSPRGSGSRNGSRLCISAQIPRAVGLYRL